MATKVIKLQNGTDVLLPVSDAKYIQMTYDGITKSVHDVILENEEVTAASCNELNDRVLTLEHAGYITSFTESDPTVPSYVKGITQSDIAYWNNKGEKQFIVNVSYVNGEYVSDKTSDQISDAINAGQVPTVCLLSAEYYSNLGLNEIYIQYLCDYDHGGGNAAHAFRTCVYNTFIEIDIFKNEVSLSLDEFDIFNADYYYTKSFINSNYYTKLQINAASYLQSETDPTVPSYVKSISQADIAYWNNKGEKQFIVNVSYVNDEYVSDKTSAQISDAINAGQIPTLCLLSTDDENVRYPDGWIPGKYLQYSLEYGEGAGAYVFSDVMDNNIIFAVVTPEEVSFGVDEYDRFYSDNYYTKSDIDDTLRSYAYINGSLSQPFATQQLNLFAGSYLRAGTPYIQLYNGIGHSTITFPYDKTGTVALDTDINLTYDIINNAVSPLTLL